jgi:hypothetical protein
VTSRSRLLAVGVAIFAFIGAMVLPSGRRNTSAPIVA